MKIIAIVAGAALAFAPGVSLAAQLAETGLAAPKNPFSVLEGMDKKKPGKTEK